LAVLVHLLYAESTKDVAIYPTHCFNGGH
jgi:hypothetical protein